jgi:hypothetical protein
MAFARALASGLAGGCGVRQPDMRIATNERQIMGFMISFSSGHIQAIVCRMMLFIRYGTSLLGGSVNSMAMPAVTCA